MAIYHSASPFYDIYTVGSIPIARFVACSLYTIRPRKNCALCLYTTDSLYTRCLHIIIARLQLVEEQIHFLLHAKHVPRLTLLDFFIADSPPPVIWALSLLDARNVAH